MAVSMPLPRDDLDVRARGEAAHRGRMLAWGRAIDELQAMGKAAAQMQVAAAADAPNKMRRAAAESVGGLKAVGILRGGGEEEEEGEVGGEGEGGGGLETVAADLGGALEGGAEDESNRKEEDVPKGMDEAIQTFVWETKEMEKKRRRNEMAQLMETTDWNVSAQS